jgi:AraC-like DNA-binding protein
MHDDALAFLTEHIQLIVGDLLKSNDSGISLNLLETSQILQIRQFFKTQVLDDPTTQLPLKDIADLFDISQYQLIRRFRTQFGITPHAYQVCLRLEQAKKLLMMNHDICDVAVRTGFTDQSHFTRCFKRAFFTTPGQFRRQLQ